MHLVADEKATPIKNILRSSDLNGRAYCFPSLRSGHNLCLKKSVNSKIEISEVEVNNATDRFSLTIRKGVWICTAVVRLFI